METVRETVRVLFPLNLGGVDLSITSPVAVLWFAAALIFGLAFLATRGPQLVPGRLQNFFELLFDFFDSQTADLFGSERRTWTPYVFTLFCFILVNNLLGLVPGIYPVSSNINITATLAVIVFLTYHLAGVRDRGWLGYLRSVLVPRDVPWAILPLMTMIELIGQLARPFSLAIRLFANMTAGQLIAFTLLSFIFVFKSVWFVPFPLLGRVVIGLFEVFVSVLQAYVFAYLAALYIGLAIQEEH